MSLKSLCILLAGLLTVSFSAQEPPKYEELKKMYDSAVGSLKASQEAKNQLATKNEELAKQVAELQKQLDAASKERDELQRQAAQYAEKTYNLRAQNATWQEFLRRYPTLAAKWKVYLEAEILRAGHESPTLIDPSWPFKVEG